MKIIDMSHVMNVHTPGWVGYAGNKMYYAQNLQTQMIVAQRIDTALHGRRPRSDARSARRHSDPRNVIGLSSRNRSNITLYKTQFVRLPGRSARPIV